MSKIKIVDLVSKLKNESILATQNLSVQNFSLSHSNISDRIKISHLYIDDRTQRGIDKKRAKKISQMASDFNPYKFGMPLITQDNDGNYFVVDGQGRSIAALLAGFEEIPYQKMTKPNNAANDTDWQGELFITQYDNTENVSGWQLYDVASELNINSMRYKSGIQQVSRATDIKNLLLKLNSNNNNWTFGYHIDSSSVITGYTVDLTKAYKYVVDGIIRETHNFDATSKPGSRNAKALEAALNVFAEYTPGDPIIGQNLEVIVVYIKKTADELKVSRGLPFVTNSEINDAAKRLCYMISWYSSSKRTNNLSHKLTQQELKILFKTINAANKTVATTGVSSLNDLWKSILKNKSYSQSQYEQFANKFTIV